MKIWYYRLMSLLVRFAIGIVYVVSLGQATNVIVWLIWKSIEYDELGTRRP